MYGKPESIDKPTRDKLDNADKLVLNKARDILLALFDGYYADHHGSVDEAVLDLMGLEEESVSYMIDECCSGGCYTLTRAKVYKKTKCEKCCGTGEVGEYVEVE
ncbi:MAG: hypothetical protein ACYTGV_16595 [Planctomycetota bacterium]|jgi:hypothetical protein